MYIFKNSIKNLLRNKGRNILIFLILFVTMTAVTTCAIVRQAANKQMEKYIQSFNPAVSMLSDYGRLAEDYPAQEVTNIDGSTYYEIGETPDINPALDLLEEWEQSKYVDHADWWLTCQYYTELNSFKQESLFGHEDFADYYGKDAEYFRQMAVAEFESQKSYYLSEQFRLSALYEKLCESGHIVTEQEAEEFAARTIFGDKYYQEYLDNGISDKLADRALARKFGYDGMMEQLVNENKVTAEIWAYSDYESKGSYFTQKLLSLKEGHYPYNLNECLISNRFAEMNSLKIGDTIEVINPYDQNAKLELTICGLFAADYYEATADEEADGWVNNIFTSIETIRNCGFEYAAIEPPTYYLKSTDDVTDFKQMLSESGLSEYVSLSDNKNELESLIKPIEKISKFATILMVVTLILGGAVFLLLTFLAVGERKYEIGVLRSIGMKKNKIIRGFLYETAVIVLTCCIVGIAVGTVISQPVANRMLSQNTSEDANENKGYNALDDVQVNVSSGVGDSNSFESVGGEVMIATDSDGMVSNVSESTTESEKTEFHAQLSWSTVIVILATAFILMIAAVVIASLYITKFEPIKILSDQE